MSTWVLLQLVDSAFPTGGFAHSSGLEVMAHAGEIRSGADVARFVEETIAQATHGALPFVLAVFDQPSELASVDDRVRATMWSHVASRASVAQGRAFLDAASKTFHRPAFDAARGALTQKKLQGHLAPVFGFVTRELDVARDDVARAFLHLSVRGVLSAAVRLGLIGPFEAQSIQHAKAGLLEAAQRRGSALTLDDVAQVNPVIELLQAKHDGLYSRLFQS